MCMVVAEMWNRSAVIVNGCSSEIHYMTNVTVCVCVCVCVCVWWGVFVWGCVCVCVCACVHVCVIVTFDPIIIYWFNSFQECTFEQCSSPDESFTLEFQ